MVRYLFYTIGDLTYQSPLVPCVDIETINYAFGLMYSLINGTNHSTMMQCTKWESSRKFSTPEEFDITQIMKFL